MLEDDVANADAREAARLEAMKSEVGRDVRAQIGGQASVASSTDRARVSEVAADMRRSAIDETVHTGRKIDHARTAARGSQFLDYAFYVLYTLLAVRLVLALIAANSANGFVQFISTITNPFYAPFRGIVDSPSTEGGNTLVFPIVIAMVVYAIVHVAINGLLRMVGNRKTSI
jgi:uncharacterized protein YggT (Ycf19 family)